MKAKPKTKEAEIEVVEVQEKHTIQYVFTEEEMKDKSKLLANACKEKQTVEDNKKSVMSEFKFKLDIAQSEINILSGHISNGYEMRNVICVVKKFFDRGEKEIWHDGILYATEKLTDVDYQMKIELNENNSQI